MESQLEIICPAWYPGVDKLIEAIPILADQGVTALEIGLNAPEYVDYRNGSELQRLLDALSSSGVRAHSIHSPFGAQYDISSLDDSIHERGVDSLIDSIELASVIDADKVIVHASDHLNGERSHRMERARGVLREMGVVAAESGIVLALENLPPGHLGHTPEEIISLLDRTDRGSVGVCFDSGHANMSGHFMEFASALLPLAVTIHLHDNDGTADQHAFPGLGSIDWPGFASTYRVLECKATLIIECKLPDSMIWSEAFHQLRTEMGE
jgi:sugar phosphate isomerase/epimerase